jgi:hypothetical protein
MKVTTQSQGYTDHGFTKDKSITKDSKVEIVGTCRSDSAKVRSVLIGTRSVRIETRFP